MRALQLTDADFAPPQSTGGKDSDAASLSSAMAASSTAGTVGDGSRTSSTSTSTSTSTSSSGGGGGGSGGGGGFLRCGFFLAAWGEPMRVEAGDWIVMPLVSTHERVDVFGEIYRIEQGVFEATYRPQQTTQPPLPN